MQGFRVTSDGKCPGGYGLTINFMTADGLWTKFKRVFLKRQ